MRGYIDKEIQCTEKQASDIKSREKRSKEALKLLKQKMKRKHIGKNI